MARGRNDGFTDKQRKWILDRDSHTCQLCFEKAERLEVHHITPWRYSMAVLHWTLERTNLPTNGITLCYMCHRGDSNSIHPDIARAKMYYHQDKAIFNKVFAKRDELCRQHLPYWATGFDNKLAERATMNTLCYIAQGHTPDPWTDCKDYCVMEVKDGETE